MPKLFIVSDEADTAALAKSLLGVQRLGAARRDALIEALRGANPALDLDRLRQGMIVTVPDGLGLGDRVDDPVASAIDDLVSWAAAAVEGFPAEADRAEEVRRAEAEGIRALLGSDEIVRLSADNPQLEKNIASVDRVLEQQDAAAQADRDALAESAKAWTEQLRALQALAESFARSE